MPRPRRKSKLPRPPLTDEQRARVEANLGLVWHMVKRYSRLPMLGTSADDMAQAGFLALCRAARSFNPDVGICFSTYATTSIRHAVIDEVRFHSSLIHVPAHAAGTRAGETRDEAYTRLRPTLFSAFEWEHLTDAYANSGQAYCGAHDPIDAGAVDPLEAAVASEERQIDCAALDAAMNVLSEQQARVMRLRAEGYKHREVGALLGISKQRVQQIESRAREKWRDRRLALEALDTDSHP